MLKFTGLVNRKVNNELNLSYNQVSSGWISFSASCAPYCGSWFRIQQIPFVWCAGRLKTSAKAAVVPESSSPRF